MLRSPDIPLVDIIDLSGDAILIADADTGMLLYGNKKACELTGWSPDEIESLHQTDLHPREELEVYKEYFQSCKDTCGAVSKGDRYVVTRDGRKVPVEICATTLEWNGRKIIKGIFRNLSERKTLEAAIRDILAKLKEQVNDQDTVALQQKQLLKTKLEEQDQIKREYERAIDRYRNIFYIICIPMLVFDADETILLVNREFEWLTGYERDELEGKKNWMECIAVYDMERLKSYQYDVMKQKAHGNDNREFCIIDKNGYAKTVSIAIIMLPGSDRGLVSFIDVTNLRNNYEINMQKREELETRCHYLEKVNEALQALLKSSENEKVDVQGNILTNVKEMIMPCIAELKQRYASNVRLLTELNILETNLKNIVSPFSRRLTLNLYNLSPREIQVASLIKEGRATKEIMEILNLSKSSIDLHRYHIRKKLGLTKEKINLRSFLLSLQ
jgi:PAS domain S-box-containing protein